MTEEVMTDARSIPVSRRIAALAFLLVAYFFYAWSWNTVDILRPCSTEVGRSLDDKSSPGAAGKKTKKGDDVDKDGIVHEDESKIGTDPCHYDTDDDGLADPWEASGVGDRKSVV